MKRSTILVILSYLTVYLVWGSTYFFIKLAVTTIPPLYVLGLRWLVGGILFLGFAYFTGRFKRLPTFREVLAALFLGAFLIMGGNGLITIAEQRVDSYLAALILAATPVVVVFFDWVLLRKRVAGLTLTGILLGMTGVGLLLYNGHSVLSSLRPEILLVLGGLFCWSFATSLGAKVKVYQDVFVNSGIQMLLIGAGCLAIGSHTKPTLVQILPTISMASIIGLSYLAIFGSLAFVAYNYLIIHEPASRIVSYAFVNPVIATLLGLVIGKEQEVPYLWQGFPLILLGLFLMVYGPIIFQRVKNNWPKGLF